LQFSKPKKTQQRKRVKYKNASSVSLKAESIALENKEKVDKRRERYKGREHKRERERERERGQTGGIKVSMEGGKSETGNKRTKLTPVEYWERDDDDDGGTKRSPNGVYFIGLVAYQRQRILCVDSL
jgi:hypothetical protein